MDHGEKVDCNLGETGCGKIETGRSISKIFKRIWKKSYNPSFYNFIEQNFFYYTIESNGVTTSIGSCVIPKPTTKEECVTAEGDEGVATHCFCKGDLCNMSSRIQAPLFMTIIAIFLASKM